MSKTIYTTNSEISVDAIGSAVSIRVEGRYGPMHSHDLTPDEARRVAKLLNRMADRIEEDQEDD